VDAIASLTREPFVVDSVSWESKVVRTGGPSGPLHDEWTLLVRARCGAPVRAMAFPDADGVRWHARDWGRRSERLVELRVSFSPFDWDHSDKVVIGVADAGIRVSVDSAALKAGPAAMTGVDVEVGTTGHTGVPLSILGIPELGISVGVLLVRSTDTKADRTRWRVRDEHAGGLGEFSFLAAGSRSGSTPLRG
jgi:hypothetical protein